MKNRDGKHSHEMQTGTVVYTFQCTQEMSDKISKKAGQKGIEASKLIEGYIEAGLKIRQPRGLKAKVCVQVEVQEAINQALLQLDADYDTKNKITEILKEAMPLWEN